MLSHGKKKYSIIFFSGYEGYHQGLEMACSDEPNGEIGINGCSGIFHCVTYCDGVLCNMVHGSAPGLHKSNIGFSLVFVVFSLIVNVLWKDLETVFDVSNIV